MKIKSVSFRPEQIQKLKDHKEKTNVPENVIIRMALDEWFARMELSERSRNGS